MYHPGKVLTKKAISAIACAVLISGAIQSPGECKKRRLATTGGAQLIVMHEPERVLSSDKLPLSKKILKNRPSVVKIYEYDNTPIGDREPLLFVHGLNGELSPHFRWPRVIQELKKNQDLQARYKMYLTRYSTQDRIDSTVVEYRKAVGQLYEVTGKRPITIVALSMGGNLAYQGMVDKETDSKIRALLTMGTMYHGSPLFTVDWMQYSLYKRLCWPITRIDHSLAYKMYFNKNKNLVSDFSWDDTDNSMPDVGRFRSKLLFGPKGQLTLIQNVNNRLARLNSEPTSKKKIIAYSGYLINPYMHPQAERIIENTFMYPLTFLTQKFPAHLAREHPVLGFMNRDIANIATTSTTKKAAGTPFVFSLNDGITPVVSAICLPEEAMKSVTVARESDIPKLKNYVDVGTARVFRNIDHLTFIDGYRPVTASSLIKDELNPDAGTRTIWDWLLYDLLHSEQVNGQLAKETEASVGGMKTD